MKGELNMSDFKHLESIICTLYKRIQSKKMPFGDIILHKAEIQSYASFILESNCKPTDIGLNSILMLCLDEYTYSDSGNVLISDHEYDLLHSMYMDRGYSQIIYPDTFDSEWKIVKHKATWMVGSVRKVYDIEELREFIRHTAEIVDCGLDGISWVVSPKFDGISAVLELKDQKLVQAITRGTRAEGQDITQMVSRVSNLPYILKNFPDGFLKVELCVPQCFFGDLKDAGYANRRSATSAIVNSPKNLQWANHVDAIPLLHYAIDGKIVYCPKDSETMTNVMDPQQLINKALGMLNKIRASQYEYRVDGVILYPLIVTSDTEDVMALSMAFKINTAEARTKIKYAYISVGRAGYAVPMLKVEPCEVNETIVEDISMGSFGKLYAAKLHEGETVIVYSAGDVIPQVKIPNEREYPHDAPIIHLEPICPYCGGDLHDNKCTNPNCIRVITGKITNFLIKIGMVDDISDKTIEDLYNARLIRIISDIFDLRECDIAEIPGYSAVSAHNIVSQIQQMKKTPIPYSVFFGAIGIPGISTKFASTIFDNITPEQFLSANSQDRRLMLMGIPGLGPARTEAILHYMVLNSAEVKKLMNQMTLIQDRRYFGNVVFTGFRDSTWESKFDAIGLRSSGSVTKETLCCICANTGTTKAKDARKKGVPMYLVSEIQKAYDDMKELYEKRLRNSSIESDDLIMDW